MARDKPKKTAIEKTVDRYEREIAMLNARIRAIRETADRDVEKLVDRINDRKEILNLIKLGAKK